MNAIVTIIIFLILIAILVFVLLIFFGKQNVNITLPKIDCAPATYTSATPKPICSHEPGFEDKVAPSTSCNVPFFKVPNPECQCTDPTMFVSIPNGDFPFTCDPKTEKEIKQSAPDNPVICPNREFFNASCECTIDKYTSQNPKVCTSSTTETMKRLSTTTPTCPQFKTFTVGSCP